MTENITVIQLAKELNLKALELLEKIRPLDLKVKNHMAELSGEQADRIRTFLNPAPSGDAAPKKKTVSRRAATKKDEKEVAAAPAAASTAKPIVITRTRASEGEAAPTVIRRRTGAEEAAVETSQELGAQREETSIEDIATEAPLMADADAAPFEGVEELVAVESTEGVPESVEAIEAPVAAAAPAPDAGVVRRTARFSVIRVVSPEPMVRAKPLIVEEAPAGAEKTYGQRRGGASVPKTFSDPELARTGSTLIKQYSDEDQKKKASTAPRRDDERLFKSTDYLRRERVYQPKKKRISIGYAQKRTSVTQASAHKRVVDFDTQILLGDLADSMSVKAMEVAKKLRALGMNEPPDIDRLEDWTLDLETAQLVAAEFQFELRDETFSEEDVLEQIRGGATDEDLAPRSPVITIMGHVDHGKTSLLDVIRRARIASGEAGGITQHIGAYTVNVSEAVKNLQSHTENAGKDKKDKKKDRTENGAKGKGKGAGPAADRLTFLDTPGHAAFTSMRARGAKVTDIVVLVVSAVDGVMPQTREAIEHARAAEVPMIVAVNKMDLPDANPDRIRQQLSEFNVISEDWGGDTIFVPVSAKAGTGVDKLLEMIQIQAELLELKARPDGLAEGALVEAKLDKGRGPVATVLVSAGQLKVGDYVVAGTQTGRVRALIDDKGKNVQVAGPSTPVEILGLGGVPEAGDMLTALDDEKSAKQLVENRLAQKKAEASGNSLEDLYARMNQGDLKELPIILKADVKGSAEAIQFALGKLPQNKVRLKVLTAGVGGITESDVLLASASKAVIFGFNVRADSKSEGEAERRGVQIKSYSIIYELIDEVTKAMEGMLAPTMKETVVGRAEVRNVFTITKVGIVAGSAVIKGKIQRSNSVRLIRDNRVIYTGKLSGLKRFKDDAREVAEGFECGISIDGYTDIKAGDIVEAFTVEAIAGKLNEGAGASA